LPGSPSAIFYRAMALERLGRVAEAKPLLESLLQFSGRSRVLAPYAAGLGQAGLGDLEKAKSSLQQALAIDPAHIGARSALAALNGGSLK